MQLASVILLLVAFTMTADAQYYYYYYPYTYDYYPYTYYYPVDYYYYYKRDGMSNGAPKPTYSTCSYVKNDEIFKCTGPLGEIECEAEWKMDKSKKLELFAIGKPSDFMDLKSFQMFPRRLDNSAWLDNVVKVDGEEFNITLHSGDSSDYGVEIKERECFKKIGELMKDSGRDELIYLADNNLTARVIADFSLVMRVKQSGHGKYEQFFADEFEEKFLKRKRSSSMSKKMLKKTKHY